MTVRSLAARFLFCAMFGGALGPLVMAQTAAPAATAATGTQKKSKKDKAKTDRSAVVISDAAEFSDAVANAVLGQIRDGLEAHSQGLMLSAFDRDKFDGYLAFEDQVQSYFEKYDSFRTHFRILQTSVEDAKGVVLAEFDVEGMPSGGGAAMRRSNQLRFELARGSQGWKVVDVRPRGFFS